MTLRFLDALGRWKTLLGQHSGSVRKGMVNLSPPRNEGLKDLSDKSLFKLSFPVLAVRVPAFKTAEVLRAPVMRQSV